ncbi:MAG: hypothetical protein M5U09_16870 [Gammaproteobacteria bacterium]|nr:hypothetical protein [Gammaproteobacteria bacterium]
MYEPTVPSAEGIGDIGPVPVLDAGRGVLVEQRDVVLERRQRLGGVDRDALAVEPFAAVGAKDRRVDVHVLAGAAESPEGAAPQAVVGIVHGLGVGHVFLERLGRGKALCVVDVLAIDLYRRLAVVGNAVRAAVHRGGAAVARLDVVVVEPGGVGQAGVAEVVVERIDPAVGDVQHVVHRVGGMRGVGAGLARQVQHRLLADLPRRNHLEPRVDAGQGPEVRQYGLEVVEIAGGNDGDGDALAFGHAPVDAGAAERLEVHELAGGMGAADEQARRGDGGGSGGGGLQDVAAGEERAAPAAGRIRVMGHGDSSGGLSAVEKF